MSNRNRSKASLSSSRGFPVRESANQIQLAHFQAPSFGICDAEFEAEPGTVAKRALVLVEGSHTDSAKRHHSFDADRIFRIVENTNNWLAKGGRVPWQLDHKKTQDANIGDLESGLEAKIITEEDLPNPKLRHLIGKIGAFAERLVGKGSDVVNMVNAGRVKTLSPGIDVSQDIIKEISATPTPAIVGLSTFNQGLSNFALTMDEAEQEGEQSDALKEQFEEKGELFLQVVNSIYSASEDELQGQDPQALLMQAIQDYSNRVAELIGVGQEQPGNNLQQGQPQGAPMPGYLLQQQGLPPNAGAMAQMGGNQILAAFTLADMHKIVNHDRAEFLFGIGEQPRYSVPTFKPKKQRSLLGTVAKVGAIGLGGAAAIRYGGAGLVAGAKGATRALKQGIVSNPSKVNYLGVATRGVTSGYKRGTSLAGQDFNRLRKGAGRIKNAVGTGLSSGYKSFTSKLPKPPTY